MAPEAEATETIIMVFWLRCVPEVEACACTIPASKLEAAELEAEGVPVAMRVTVVDTPPSVSARAVGAGAEDVDVSVAKVVLESEPASDFAAADLSFDAAEGTAFARGVLVESVGWATEDAPFEASSGVPDDVVEGAASAAAGFVAFVWVSAFVVVVLAPETDGLSKGANMEGAESDGKASDGAASEGKPTDGNPSDGAASVGKARVGAASDGRPSDGNPSVGPASDGKPSDGRPSAGAALEGSEVEAVLDVGALLGVTAAAAEVTDEA